MTKLKEGTVTPTHKVVGPDGTEYFLIRQTRNTLRIKILFSTVDYMAGFISDGWGPSAADDVMMGRWIGPLRHHFGRALDCLPDGTHCVEVAEADRVSLYDYQTDVIWSGWGSARYRDVALRRAGCKVGGLNGLPVVRPDLAKAKAAVEAHKAALLDGTYRRDDGPMVKNTAPRDPGVAYYPTYVKGEGTPVPADILPGFIADADLMLDYIAFMESIPPLPERPRRRPATASELAHYRAEAGWTHKPEPIRAYARFVVETGMIDLPLQQAAEAERVRLANIEHHRRQAEKAA